MRRTFSKNQEIELLVEDLGKDGQGIGHADGYTLFVKDAVPGDRILAGITKAGKGYGYARVIRVLEPSPDRVAPACPVAKRCGGCQLMTLSAPAQLRFKEKLVRDALERIGGFSVRTDGALSDRDGREESICLLPIIPSDVPVRYRNKAQYPVQMVNGQIAAGFYAQHSHQVVPADDCFLAPSEQHEVLQKAVELLNRHGVTPYDEKTGRGLIRHILIREAFESGAMHVCFVINGMELPYAEKIAEGLMEKTFRSDRPENNTATAENEGHKRTAKVTGVSCCVNESRGNRILGEKLTMIAGEETIEETIGHCRYRISPLSFFQINPVQTKKLYDTVREYAALTGRGTVYDLYCGAGTIGQYLADGAAKITGIEIVPQAIENAKINAALNGIRNASYYAGAAEDLLPELLAKEKAENAGAGDRIVIVDPPRKGCDRKLLDTVLGLAPEKIIYVSCDPATLARDLRILTDGGYKAEKVQPLECFSMSVHVETVCLLTHS